MGSLLEKGTKKGLVGCSVGAASLRDLGVPYDTIPKEFTKLPTSKKHMIGTIDPFGRTFKKGSGAMLLNKLITLETTECEHYVKWEEK